jgi:beta-glucosidase
VPCLKHFALNDQEEGRYGVSVWANEQSIREIYLKAFEGGILAGANGVMTSFNRIGVVWSGGHHGLMTGILRNEWGFEGVTITDMSINAKWMDYRIGLLAGQDIWCGQKGNMGTLDGSDNDPAISNAVQQAIKNTVFAVTRSNAMNIGDATIVTVTPWWQTALYIACGVMAAVTAGCGVMAVVTGRKIRREA